MKLYDVIMKMPKDMIALDLKLLGEEKPSRALKSELCRSLSEKLLDRDIMSLILSLASPRELDVFEDAVDADSVSVEEIWDIVHLSQYGYLLPAGGGVSAAEDVKEAYAGIRSDVFYKQRDGFWPLIDYLSAFVCLYGVISVENAVKLFRFYEGGYAPEEVIRQCMSVLFLRNTIFYIDEGYVLHKSLLEEPEDIGELLELQGDKPFYLPAKGEILRYADDWFFEKTPEYYDTRKFLSGFGVSGEELEAHMEDICYALQEEETVEDLMDMDLEIKGFKKSRENTMRLKMLLSAQRNATRMWTNRGFTPNEIMARAAKKGPKAAPYDIDRNAPCPCGSGKKYKDCCGNIISFKGIKTGKEDPEK